MGLLGIIGGMGPLATELFYKRLIEKTDAACDQEHLDMIILNHASIPDRTEAIKSGDTKKVIDKLVSDAVFLEKSGATAIAIPCNTSHYFWDSISESVNIPVINMVRETVSYAAQKGKKRLCVLATDGTLMTGTYKKECLAHGIEYVAPTPEIQSLVMRIIYEQIKRGFPGSTEDFYKISHFIKSEGCDGAVLACTELSVFKEEAGLGDFYIDALEVLCEKSILTCGKPLREDL